MWSRTDMFVSAWRHRFSVVAAGLRSSRVTGSRPVSQLRARGLEIMSVFQKLRARRAVDVGGWRVVREKLTLTVCSQCGHEFFYIRATRRRVYCSLLCRGAAKGARVREVRASSGA